MKDPAATTTPIVPVPFLPPGLSPPPGLLAELRAAYASEGRAYHNWRHVADMLDHLAEVEDAVGWERPREVWLAAVFHDAVYVAGAKDNEAASAALARASIARWYPEVEIDVDRVVALIELTARHGRIAPGEVDRDAALFLDCDLAIVGAEPAAFDRYDDGIAQEWCKVIDDAAYRAGRRAFLERLLAAPRIFLSEYFHARLDAAARANLRRALDRC